MELYPENLEGNQLHLQQEIGLSSYQEGHNMEKEAGYEAEGSEVME